MSIAQEYIAIVDFGSQYTFLLARRLRELGIYSEIVPSIDNAFARQDIQLSGVILSGGPDSIGDIPQAKLEQLMLSFRKIEENNIPVLGVCFGMQIICHYYGAVVRQQMQREYGKAEIIPTAEFGNAAVAGEKEDREGLFHGVSFPSTVWMSHGDDIEHSGDAFGKDNRIHILCETKSHVIAAVKVKDTAIFGVQFHPEVVHSDAGETMLRNFCVNICQMSMAWNSSNIFEKVRQEVVQEAANIKKVLVGVSGGVDSSVLGLFLTEVLGRDKVVPVMVDTGLLRKDEASQVKSYLAKSGMPNLIVLNREQEFLSALKGISDPEQKRKIIGQLFIKEFEAFAGQQDFTHLAQGTLYPDVIESAGAGQGSKVIKSHHNVGGLPEKLNLSLLEPFKFLFKDEVRAIGARLNIDSHIINRHPFPGPGLAIRIPGEVSEEKIKILQECDEIFLNELRAFELYDSIWQAFCVLLPVKSVGVMGDNRSYEYTLVLRAIEAKDGMTANIKSFDWNILTEISSKIIHKVSGVNRVLYDITGKPPATIEWE